MIDIKVIQRKQAILCMIISMVDACNGSLEMNTTNIKKVYNRKADDAVMFVLKDGSTLCLGDMDTELIDHDIREWQKCHPREFKNILAQMHL